MIDDGVVPRHAGSVACGLRAFLVANPDADQAYHIQPSLGSSEWRATFDATQTHLGDGASSPDVISIRVWNFHYLRGRIVKELTDAANVVGSVGQ